MKRFSLRNNLIADVPSIFGRYWYLLQKGPLKWICLGAAAALATIVACVPTIKDPKEKVHGKRNDVSEE
jgi:hypothetical protein